VLIQGEAVRSRVELVPRLARLKDGVWRWLERHWNLVSVLVSGTVVAVLLVTSALPLLLAPFVLGPLGAVVMTALVARHRA
jgi:hypothetical protein